MNGSCQAYSVVMVLLRACLPLNQNCVAFSLNIFISYHRKMHLITFLTIMGYQQKIAILFASLKIL